VVFRAGDKGQLRWKQGNLSYPTSAGKGRKVWGEGGSGRDRQRKQASVRKRLSRQFPIQEGPSSESLSEGRGHETCKVVWDVVREQKRQESEETCSWTKRSTSNLLEAGGGHFHIKAPWTLYTQTEGRGLGFAETSR